MRQRLMIPVAMLCFAVVPAAVALHLAQRPCEGASYLTAEVRGRAALLDLQATVWKHRAQELASQIGSLLAQLPPGDWGSAAEGTLALHLQNRLQRDRDMGEYAVLDVGGEVLISTDGTRAAGQRSNSMPEVAVAAERPAVALVGRQQDQVRLAVAAPVRTGQQLRAIFVAHVRPETTRRLLQVAPTLQSVVVDADGRVLGDMRHPPPALVGLGTETAAGQQRLAAQVVAYFPLREARAVVVVAAPVGPASERWPWPWWHFVALAALAVVALAVGWLLVRA